MSDFSKEIRTPKKHLLVGTVMRDNDDFYLIIKSRGKTDRIAIGMIMSNICKNNKADSNENEHN